MRRTHPFRGGIVSEDVFLFFTCTSHLHLPRLAKSAPLVAGGSNPNGLEPDADTKAKLHTGSTIGCSSMLLPGSIKNKPKIQGHGILCKHRAPFIEFIIYLHT